MKSKRFLIFFLIAGIQLALLPSCSIIQQAAQMKRLSLCTFDVQGVDNIQLAGISLDEGMGRKDLNAAQIMQLTNAVFSKQLPLKLNLLVSIKNPNDKKAALSRMDYSLLIDGLELISGQMEKRYEIEPEGQTLVHIPITTELFQVLSGQSIDMISNLGFKLTGSSSQPVDLLFKVKPYIQVGLTQLAYPGFIEIAHTL
ncbi:MAG: LEA type 2 family protein [Bacteroidales bacterium]|nr:LEA type 2 family protein [Bacteroidales bacterium]